MTFALPWILAIAAIGVVTITVLHLLSVHRPPAMLLPTARFLPERDIRAVSRSTRPNDVPLLLLRIAALLCAGVALAGPRAPRGALTTLVVVAVEPGMMIDTLAAQRAIAAELGSQRVQYAFVTRSDVGAANAAALFPAATRAAAAAIASTPAIDSVALFLAQRSPVRADSVSPAWRAAWPGRVVHLRDGDTAAVPLRRLSLAPNDGVSAERGVSREVAADDAVRAALRWHIARWNGMMAANGATATDTVQLVRSFGKTAPSFAASIVIRWPYDAQPDAWSSRPAPDTTGALAARGNAVVGPFTRRAQFDTGAMRRVPLASPIVWFGDGEIAAVEVATREGCARTVAVDVEQGSDLLLSSSANGVFDALLRPCVMSSRLGGADPATALRVVARDSGALASAAAFRAPTDDGFGSDAQSMWWRWLPTGLLALALLMLFAEWRVRGRQLSEHNTRRSTATVVS